MLEKFNRNRIIKKAVEKTVLRFSNSTPRILKHFFYGAVDIGPENLVVWYLFETDLELETANNNGLCKKLEETTINNLIELGYPEDAFCEKVVNIPSKISFLNGTNEQRNNIIHALTHRSASIAFTTEEDIDKKANGDYHLYFQ